MNGRFEGRQLTGVERYGSEMVRCLGQRAKVIGSARAKSGARGHMWEQFVLPRLLGKDELLWSPANTGPLAVPKQVLTIHDLSVLDHPEWFSAGFRLWYLFLLPRLARRVAAILTVSDHSRRAIISRFQLPPAKVTAIPNGVNLQQFHPCDPSDVRAKYGLPDRYILYVGAIDPRKNLDRLVQAWARLSDFRDVQLVIAGARKGIFRGAALTNAVRRTRLLGYVADEDLSGLYAGCLFFVMPSLFEGFGLSVLEAMACGAPVIASRAGALPEAAGEAALLVDPTSVEGMTEAMRSLLVDEALCATLRRRGLERAAEHPWERAAEAAWQVLEAHG